MMSYAWRGGVIFIIDVYGVDSYKFEVENQIISLLKGQSREIFVFRFFHQTDLPGPIRDVLGPY